MINSTVCRTSPTYSYLLLHCATPSSLPSAPLPPLPSTPRIYKGPFNMAFKPLCCPGKPFLLCVHRWKNPKQNCLNSLVTCCPPSSPLSLAQLTLSKYFNEERDGERRGVREAGCNRQSGCISIAQYDTSSKLAYFILFNSTAISICSPPHALPPPSSLHHHSFMNILCIACVLRVRVQYGKSQKTQSRKHKQHSSVVTLSSR